jgi:hypothetical protein
MLAADQAPTIEGANPCIVPDAGPATAAAAPPRFHVSRRGAIYIAQHIQKACDILAAGSTKGMQPAPQASEILTALRAAALYPIYRSYPELARTAPTRSRSQPVFKATPRDIDRASAAGLINDLNRVTQDISKLSAASLDNQSDKSAAEAAIQHFTDVIAELSFAEKVAFDAYPDLFVKEFGTIPQQSRNEKSDAVFRKLAPPLGSIRLSNSALAMVKSFMQNVRCVTPNDDQIPAIGWVREQRKKGPGDTAWSMQGPGWALGAYSRKQIPPDVIDNVSGIDIMFSAEDPSSIAGKTFDVRKHKLFLRD